MSSGLTFRHLSEVNRERCPRFGHTLHDWTPLEWAGAMCGEAGEAANVAKKIRRVEQGCNVNAGTRQQLVDQLAGELADIVIYADLLASREGIDLGTAVARKFDEVSDRVGYTRRLSD